MGGLNSGPGPGITLLIAIVIILAHKASSAPLYEDEEGQESNSQALVESHGCYYNFQHYNEGERILTNEPCLNCTCRNRMLMCYLRVCPFTKGIGQNCTVEKVPGQCCPIITCPEVPVQLLTSTTTEGIKSPGGHHGTKITAVGHLDTNGCNIDGVFYPNGAQVPGAPEKPCELCYCIRNKTACIMQECALHVDGCRPIYEEGQCFPVRYQCDDSPYEEESTTTIRPPPTPGLVITTTSSEPLDCAYNNEVYEDGSRIQTEDPCEHCYCLKGKIACAVQECGAPLEKEGQNCTALPPAPGKCCPDSYQCDVTMTSQGLSHEGTTKPGIPSVADAGHPTHGYHPDGTSEPTEHTTKPFNRVTTTAGTHSKEKEDVKPELDKGTQPDISSEELRPMKPGSTSDSDEKITFPDDIVSGNTSATAVGRPDPTKEHESSDHTTEGYVIHTANEKQPHPESESHKTDTPAVQEIGAKKPTDQLKPAGTTDPLLDKLHNIIQDVQAQVSDGKTTEMPEQVDYQTTTPIQTGHFTEKPDILSHLPHLGFQSSTPSPVESGSNTTDTKAPEDGSDIINKLQGIIHGIYSHVTDSILSSKQPETTTPVDGIVTKEPIDSVGLGKPNKEDIQPHGSNEDQEKPLHPLRPRPGDSEGAHTTDSAQEQGTTKIPLKSKPQDSSQQFYGSTSEKVKPSQFYPGGVSSTEEYVEGVTSTQYPERVKPGQKYPENATPSEKYPDQYPTQQYPEGVQPGQNYPDRLRPTEENPEGEISTADNLEKLKPSQSKDKVPELGKPLGEYPELIKPPGEHMEKLKPGQPTDKLPELVQTGQYHPEGHRPTEEYSIKVTPTGEYPEGITKEQHYSTRKPGQKYPEEAKPTGQYPGGIKPGEKYPDNFQPTENYPGEGPTEQYPGIKPGQHYPEGIRPGEKYSENVTISEEYPQEIKPTEQYNEEHYPEGVKPVETHPEATKPGQEDSHNVRPTNEYPEGVTAPGEYSDKVRPTEQYPDGIRPGQSYSPEEKYPDGVKPNVHYPEKVKPGEKGQDGLKPTQGYPERNTPTEKFVGAVSSSEHYIEGVTGTNQYLEVKPGQRYPEKIKPEQKYPEDHHPEEVKPSDGKPGQKYPQGTTEEYLEESRPTELYPESVKPGLKPGVHHTDKVRPIGENLYEGKPGQKYPVGITPTINYPETITTEQYIDGVTLVEYYPDKMKPGEHYSQKKPVEAHPDGVKPTEEFPDIVSTPGQYPEEFRPTQKYPEGVKPGQHSDGKKPEKYPFEASPTGEYPHGEKQGQNFSEGLRPTGEHPEEDKPAEEYLTKVKPGQYPDGVKPGQHHPEEVNLTEKYPGGSKPEEDYSEGVGSTVQYPEGIRPTEKYPGVRPGQHHPLGEKPVQKYPDEHHPEGIRPTEKYQEKVKPGQKYPDNVRPTEHFEGIRPTNIYPEGSTGYYSESVRPTEKYPEGVRPEQPYPDRVKPGQEYPDTSSPTGQYPEGSTVTNESPEGIGSTGQYLEEFKPTEEYPEGVQPGRFPDKTKVGDKHADGIRPIGEHLTERYPDRVTPIGHYPEKTGLGQKYPDGVKPTEEYPNAVKPTGEYHEGVKPEQPLSVGIKPGEKYPERVKPDQKYPASTRPPGYPEETRPSGQNFEDFKPGQHYPVGVEPSEQSVDGLKPGQSYPESVKPTDEYPEGVKPGQHYPEKIRPTGQYPEETGTTEELNSSEKYPEGVRPTGQYSEEIKPEQHYPEEMKPGEKYPDDIRPGGEYPSDSKHPLRQKPHSPGKYPETGTEFGVYTTGYPDESVTTDIPGQFNKYPEDFQPGKPGVHGSFGITVKPEISTKYTDLLTPEEESKHPDGYKPHGQKPAGATEETDEREDHTKYPEEQMPTGQYPESSKYPSTDKHPPKSKPVADQVSSGTESPEIEESSGNTKEPDELKPFEQTHPVTGKPENDNKYPEGSKPIGQYPDSSEKPNEYPESFKPTGTHPQESKVTSRPSIKYPQRPKPGSVDDFSETEYPETTENEVEDELSTNKYPVKGKPEYGTEYPSETGMKPELIKRPHKPKPGEETESSETEAQASPHEDHGKPEDAEHGLKHPEKKPWSGSDQPEKPEDDLYGTEYPTGATGRPELYPGVSRRPTGSHKDSLSPDQVGAINESDKGSDITGKPQFDLDKYPQEKLKPTGKYPERPTVTGQPENYLHKKPSQNEYEGTEHPETPESKLPDKTAFGRPQQSHTEEPETDKPHGSYTTEKTYVTEYPEKPSPPNAEDQLLESGSKSTSRPDDYNKYPEDSKPVKEENKTGFTGVTGRPDGSKYPQVTEHPDNVPGSKPDDYTKHPEGNVPDDSTKFPEGSKITVQSKYPESVRPSDSESYNKTETGNLETQSSYPVRPTPTGHHPGLTEIPQYSTARPEDGKPYGTEHLETEGTGRPHSGSKYPYTTVYPETGEADVTTHYPEKFKPTIHHPDRPEDNSGFPEESKRPQSTGFPEVYQTVKPVQHYWDKIKPEEKYPDGVPSTEGYLDKVTEQYPDNARPTEHYSEETKPELYTEGVAPTESYLGVIKPGQKYPGGVRPTEGAKPTGFYPSGVRPTEKYPEGEKPGQQHPEDHSTGAYPEENKFTNKYPDDLKPTEEYPDSFKPEKPHSEKVMPGQKYPDVASPTEEYPEGVTLTGMYPHRVKPAEGFPDEGIKPGQFYPGNVKPGQKYPPGAKPTDQYPEEIPTANKDTNGTKAAGQDFVRPEKNKPTEEYSEGSNLTGQYPDRFKPTQKYPQEFKPEGYYPEESKPDKNFPNKTEPEQKFPESGRPTGESPEDITPTGDYPEEVKPGQHYPQGLKPGQKYPDHERPTEKYPDEGRPTEQYPEGVTPTDRYPEGFKPDQNYSGNIKPGQHYPEEKYPGGLRPTAEYPDGVTSTEQHHDDIRPIGHYPAGVRPGEQYPEGLKPPREHPEQVKPEQQFPHGLRPTEENLENITPTEHYLEGIRPTENYPEEIKPGHHSEGVKQKYPSGVKPDQKYPDAIQPDQHPEGFRPTERYPDGVRPSEPPEGLKPGQKYPGQVQPSQQYPDDVKPTDEYPEGFTSTGHYTEGIGETEQYQEGVSSEGVKPEHKYPEVAKPTGGNSDEGISAQKYPEGVSSTGEYPERVTPAEPDKVRPSGHYPGNVRPGQHYPQRKPDQKYPDNVKPSQEYPEGAKPTEEYPEEVTATEQYSDGFRPTQKYPERIKPGQYYPAGEKPSQKYPEDVKPTLEYPDGGKPTKKNTTEVKSPENYPEGVRPTDQYSEIHVPQQVKPEDDYPETVKPEQTYPDSVMPTDEYSNEGKPTEEYLAEVRPEEQSPAGEHQGSKHPVKEKPGKPHTSGKPFHSESPYGTESLGDYATDKPYDSTKYSDRFSSTEHYPGRPDTSPYPDGSEYPEIGGTGQHEEKFSPSGITQQSTKHPQNFEPHATTYPESFGITHKPTTTHPDGVESVTTYPHISGVTKEKPGHEEPTGELVPESSTEYSKGQTDRPKYPLKSKPEEALEGTTSKPEDGDKPFEDFSPTGEYPYGSEITSRPQSVNKYPQRPKPGSEGDVFGTDQTGRPVSTSDSDAAADVTEYPEEEDNSSVYSNEVKPTSGEKLGVTGRPHTSTKHPESETEPGLSYYPEEDGSTKYPIAEKPEETESYELGFTGKPGQIKFPVTIRPDVKHPQKTTPSKLGGAVDSEYGTEYPEKRPGGLNKYPQAPGESEKPNIIDTTEHFGTIPKRTTQRPKPGESEDELSSTKIPEDETTEQPESAEKPFESSEYSERPKPGLEYPGEAGTTEKPSEDGEYSKKTGYLTSRPLLGKPTPTVTDESSVTGYLPDSDKYPQKPKPEPENYGTEHPETTETGLIDESEVHTKYPDKPGELEKNESKPSGSEFTSEAPDQKYPEASVGTGYSEDSKHPSTDRPYVSSKYPKPGGTDDNATEDSVTSGTEKPKEADNVIKPDERVTGMPDSQKHPQRPKPTGFEDEPYGTEYPENQPNGATDRPDKYPQRPQTIDEQYGTTIKYPGESAKLPSAEYPEVKKPGDKYPSVSHPGITEKLPEEQKPFGSEYPHGTEVNGEDLLVTPTSSEKVDEDKSPELTHQPGQYPTTSKPGAGYLPQEGGSPVESIPGSEHLNENPLPESTSQPDVGFTDRIPVTEEPDQEDLLTTLHHFTGHQDKPSSADLTHEPGSLNLGQHSTTKQPDSQKPIYTPSASIKPDDFENTKLPVSVDEYSEKPKPIVPGEGLYNPIKDNESSTHLTDTLGTTVPEIKKPDQSPASNYPSSVDPSETDKYPERISTAKPEEYTTQGSDRVSTGFAVQKPESEKPSSANRFPEEQETEEGTTSFFPSGGFTKRPGVVAPEKTDYLEKESTGVIQTTTPSDDDLINKLQNIISGIQSQVTDGKTTKLPHEEFDSTTPFASVTDVLQNNNKFGRPTQKPQEPPRTPGNLPPGNEVDEHAGEPHSPFIGEGTQQPATIPEKGPAGISPVEGDEQSTITSVSETESELESAGQPELGAHTQDTGTSYPDEHDYASKHPFDEFSTTLSSESDGVSEIPGGPSTPGELNSLVNEVSTATPGLGISFKPIGSNSPDETDETSTHKPFTGEHLQTVTPQDMSHKHPSSSPTDKPLHVVYPTYYPDGVVTRKPGTKTDEESDKKVTVTPQSTIHGEATTKTPESDSTVESHTVYNVQTEISREPGTSPVVIVHEVHTEVHSERATTKPETEGYDKTTFQPESSHLPEKTTRQPEIIQPSSVADILQPNAGQPIQQSEYTTKPALYTVTPIGSNSVTKGSEHVMHLYSSKDKQPSKTTPQSPEFFTTTSPTYPEDVKRPEQVTFGVPDKHFITKSPVGTTFKPEILGTRFPSRKTTQKPGAPIFQESTTTFPTEGIDDYHSSPVTRKPIIISTQGLPDGMLEDKHTTPDYFPVTDATKRPSQGASYVPYKLINGTKVYYPEKELPQRPETDSSSFDGYDHIPYEVVNGTKLFYPNRTPTKEPGQPIPTSTPTGMLVPYKIVNGTKVYYTEEIPEKPESFDGIDFLPFDVVNGTKVFYPERVTTATPPGSAMYVPFKIINGTKMYYPQDAEEEPGNIPDEYDGFDYIPYDLIDGNKVFHPDRIPGHVPVTEKYPTMYVPYKLVSGNKVYYPNEAQTEPESVPDEYDGFDLVPYELVNGTKFFHLDRMTTQAPISTTTTTSAMFVPFKIINGTKVYFPKLAQKKPIHSSEDFDGFDYLPYEEINGTKVFSPERATPRPEYSSTPAFYSNGMFVPYKIINNRKVFFPQDAQYKPRPLKPGYDGVQYLPYDVINGTKVFHPEKVTSEPLAMYIPYKLVNGTKVYYADKATENQEEIPEGFDGSDYVPYEVINGNKVFYPDRVVPTAGLFVPYKKTNGTKVYHPKDATEKLHHIPPGYDGVDYIPYEIINGTKVFHPEKAAPAHPPPTMYVPFRIINGTKVYFPKDARPKPYFPEGYDGADTLPYEVVNGTKVFHPKEVTEEPTPTSTPVVPQGMFVPYKVINGTKVYFTQEAHQRPHPLSDEYAGLDYVPYEVVNGTKVFHPERVSPSSAPAMYVPYKVVNGTKVFYPKYAQHDPQQIPQEYDGFDYVPYDIVNGTRVFHPDRIPSYPGLYVPYKIINGQKVFYPNHAQYNPSNVFDGYDGFDYLPYDTVNGTKVFKPVEATTEIPFEQAMYVPYNIINGTKVFYPKYAQYKPYLIQEGFDGFEYLPYKIVNGNKVFDPELVATSGTPYKPAMYVPFKIVNGTKIYYPKYAQPKPQFVPEGYDGFDYLPYETVNGTKVFHPEQAITPGTPFRPAMYVPFKIVNGKKVYYPKYAQSTPQSIPEGYDGFDYVPYETVNGTKVFHPEQAVTPGTPFRPAMYVPFKIVNGKKVYYPKYAQSTPQSIPEGYDGFDYVPYETVNGTKVFHPEQAVTPGTPYRPAMYVPFKIVNGKKVYYPKHAQSTPQSIPEGYDGFDYVPYETVNETKVFHPEQAVTPGTPFRPAMYVPYKVVGGKKVYNPKQAQSDPTALPQDYDGVDYLPYDLINGNKIFYPEESTPVKEAMYVPYKLVNGTKVFYPKHAQYIPSQTPEGYDGFEYIPYVLVNGEKVFLPEQTVTTEPPFKKALYVPYKITNGTKVYYPKNAQLNPYLIPPGYDGYDYLPYEDVNGNKVFRPEHAISSETSSRQAMYVPFKILNGTKVYYPKYAKPKPQLIPDGYDGSDYLPYDVVNGTKVFGPKAPSKPTHLQGMYVPYKLSNNTKVFYPKDAYNKPNYVPEGYDGADYVPYEPVNNTKMFYPELISTTQPINSGTQGVYVPFKLVNNKKVFYPKEATPFPPTVSYPYDGVAFVPYKTGTLPSQIIYVDDDDTLKPHQPFVQPGYVPGEGSCYLNNKTYANNTEIPPVSPCQAKCMCLSSVVRCVRVKCPAPPENRLDCSPVYREGSCCPTYACGDSEYGTTVGYSETVPESSASSLYGHGIASTTPFTDSAQKKPSTGSAAPSEEYHLHRPPKPKPEHESLEPYDSVEGHLSPDEDYDVEDEEPYGPGTCRYAGKVYVSAQQIPRDDPCDFCFCFRSDIICLQQSCPPPIPGCRDEPIQGFCCPRYECHVKTATIVNMTSTTTTTTTTLPPHFLRKPIKGWSPGCVVQGKAYRVGTAIPSASGPCLDCYCGGNGRMQCEPKVCTPEPIIRKMISPTENATASANER